MAQYIRTDLSGGVLTVTLDRPDKLNAFIAPMSAELQEALKRAAEEDDIRCMLLTGSGRAFCAGQDLPEVVEREKEEPNYELAQTVRESYNPVIRGIRHLEKPVVCAVNGTAAGAGANMAFACDIVFASSEASFVQSFSKIGLIPDSGGTFLLPRLVGLQRANMLYMLDEKISAGRAVEMGLAYRAVEPDKLMEEAKATSAKLASLPTRGFGLYKRAVNRSFGQTLDEHLELEAELQSEAGETHDYKEGVQAFLEKRKPEYTGR
ncbi:MAG: enoyl-CoA hydratase-related protein [Balneolaceae bacterium]|nr:enoyl-CoA hydratase-related protein [Balneolaceae bacterium]